MFVLRVVIARRSKQAQFFFKLTIMRHRHGDWTSSQCNNNFISSQQCAVKVVTSLSDSALGDAFSYFGNYMSACSRYLRRSAQLDEEEKKRVFREDNESPTSTKWDYGKLFIWGEKFPVSWLWGKIRRGGGARAYGLSVKGGGDKCWISLMRQFCCCKWKEWDSMEKRK